MLGIAQRSSADTEAAFIRVRRVRSSSSSATLLTAALLAACTSTPAREPGDAPTLDVSVADGAATPTSFLLAVDDADATTARLVIDGDYVGRDETPPLEFEVTVEPGTHELKVRTTGAGGDESVTATIHAGSTTKSTPPATTLPANSVPTLPATPGTISVDTVEEIRAALAEARPGDVIEVADGEYQFRPRLVASASGEPGAPITLRGSPAAVLRTKNASGDYGLHVTGDHWRIEGLTVAHASKGIVLDGSVGTVIDGVEVFDVGAEAVHFRTCSSDGVLRNSFIHDTGRSQAQYGEGVYVGSANSNWPDFECTDAVEGEPEGDNTERVLVEGNTFEDVTAEGADLKEGTDSGTLRNNTFRRVGTSGENSADSAVDAKGNNWVIEGNTVLETDAEWDDDGTMRPSEFADGLQSHSVYDGYGTGNIFRANRVVGAVPGFGIGLYPGAGNIVTCDNEAAEAGAGLVGDHGETAACGPRPLG